MCEVYSKLYHQLKSLKRAYLPVQIKQGWRVDNTAHEYVATTATNYYFNLLKAFPNILGFHQASPYKHSSYFGIIIKFSFCA